MHDKINKVNSRDKVDLLYSNKVLYTTINPDWDNHLIEVIH